MNPLPFVLVSLLMASEAGAAQRAAPSHQVGGSARPPVHEVARVNGRPLGSDRLDAAVGALIPAESFHRNVSAEKMSALRRRALQTLVDEELEYQESVRRRITVPEAEMEAAWTQMVARYGGARAFEAALGRAGVSRAAVRADLRRTLAIGKIYNRAVTTACQVGRDEAARFFKANPERFVEPEQLHVYGITVGVDPSSGPPQWAAAKARAGQALDALRAGTPLAEVALEYSTDPSRTKGGDMGLVHRGSLSETVEQAAKDLPAGRFSDVIETLYGYHIIRIAEIRPAQKKAFDEVGANLRRDLTAARCMERKEAWLAGLHASADVAMTEGPP